MIQQQQQQRTSPPFFLFFLFGNKQHPPTHQIHIKEKLARVSGRSEKLMTHMDHIIINNNNKKQTNKQQVSQTQQQDQLQLDTHTANFLSNPIWPHKHKQHPRF
jgi:succinylglutamate desuccinylase